MNESGPSPLLTSDDPNPVEIINAASEQPLVLVCEHAGRTVPQRLDQLGLDADAFDQHIAWDIGAEAVTRAMAEQLGACALLQRYSRLVIDCNRPPESIESIPEISHGTEVPGNVGLAPSEQRQRIDEIFMPFHNAVVQALDRRPAALAVSIHSFTPYLAGQRRPWDVGFLFRGDSITAEQLRDLLHGEQPQLTIGMNEPYSVDGETDWFVPVHGEQRGIAHSLIEIRNDHIATCDNQQLWADRLSESLRRFQAGSECHVA